MISIIFGLIKTRRRGDKEIRRSELQSQCLRFSLSRCLCWLLSAAFLVLASALQAHAGDLGIVPLLAGERSDSLNLWGGPLNAGNTTSFAKESSVVHSGAGAYQANLGSVPSGGFKFFQTFSSALTGFVNYRQDRDLTQYQTLEGYVRNDTSTPLTFSLELKDYRDDN